MGPTAGLEAVRGNILASTGNRIPVVHPVARRYTNLFIPAKKTGNKIIWNSPKSLEVCERQICILNISMQLIFIERELSFYYT
jgi:hypothetical protein